MNTFLYSIRSLFNRSLFNRPSFSHSRSARSPFSRKQYYDKLSYKYIRRYTNKQQRENIYDISNSKEMHHEYIDYIVKEKKYDLIRDLLKKISKNTHHAFFESACAYNNPQLIKMFCCSQDGIEHGNQCLSGNFILVKNEGNINSLSEYFNNTYMIQSGNIYLIKAAIKKPFWNTSIFVDNFNYKLIKTIIPYIQYCGENKYLNEYLSNNKKEL